MEITQLITPTNIALVLGMVLCIYIIILLQSKKRLKEALRLKTEKFHKTFDVTEDAVLMLSEKYEVLFANTAMVKLLSLKEPYISKKLELFPKIFVKNVWVDLGDFIKNLPSESFESMQSFPKAKLRFGESRGEEGVEMNLYIDRSTLQKQGCLSIVMHNKNDEQEKIAMGYRHKLTQLPNQPKALIDLNQFFAKDHLSDKKVGLVLIHIDNLLSLKATLGHEQINHILITFANYLKKISEHSAMQPYHTYYNHFLLIVPELQREDELLSLCKQIQDQLASFYTIGNVNLHLTASMGLSIYPDNGSRRTLLDNAYSALAQAEKKGQSTIVLYHNEMRQYEYDELTLYNELHKAINDGEFEIYYQPIMHAKSGDIISAEALIRWKHKKYGFIPPDIFIPIVEKTGFVVDLGQFVLEEVLKQQKRWELFKFNQIPISINMSVIEIETEGFVENVEKQLKKHNVDPHLIKFEITEGIAMRNEEHVDKQLNALKKMGISILLDDFGTGYTSFSYLKKFPADILKIDKTLVDNILTHKEDQRIVKAMIDLGHSLGMKIVIEGIENQPMVNILREYGCDYMQGYHFSRPVPVFEFQEFLRK